MAALCIGLPGSPVLEKRIGRTSAKHAGCSSSAFIRDCSESAACEAAIVALWTCRHADGHGRQFFAVLGAGVLWQHSGNRLGNFFTAAGSNQIASNKDGRSITPAGSQTAVAQNDSQSKNASAPWQWVRLSPAGSTDSDESVRLPALERNRMDQQWLQNLPSPIPQSVVQALERSGYQVQRQQELMPMPLKDGRQLVVPVDKVQLQYVGNTTY